MPTNVRWFERIMYLAGVIAVITLPWSSDLQMTVPILIWCLVWWVCVIALIWLTARRRKNWARWTLFSLFVVETLSFVWHFTNYIQNPSAGIIVMTITGLEALAYYLVFTGDAPAWFKRDDPSRV